VAVAFGNPTERAHYGRLNRNFEYGTQFDLAHYGRLVDSFEAFIDGAAGVKVWIAEGAGTVWDALDGPTVWTSDCVTGTRWKADKSC